MSGNTHSTVLHLATNGEFHLRTDGNDRALTDAESFVLGFSLVLAGKNSEAARVFRSLVTRHPQQAEYAIMLARCEIGIKDYEGSNQLLQSLFGETDLESVDILQSALLFDFLGMHDDAAPEFQKVARMHPSMALLHLLLGDCCLRKHRPDWAERCWKTALTLDTKRGGVAMLARRRIGLLERRKETTGKVHPA
jgi:hypothetical protein